MENVTKNVTDILYNYHIVTKQVTNKKLLKKFKGERKMKKKVFALTIALTMLLALALPLGASATQEVGTIILNLAAANTPPEVTANFEHLTFNAYRVFTLTGNSTSGFIYGIHGDFEDFEYDGESGEDLIDLIYGLNDTGLRRLTEALMEHIRDEDVDPTSIQAPTSTNGYRSVTFANVPRGYYLITGQVKETPPGTIAAFLALVSTGSEELDISPKFDLPKIDKVFEENEQKVNDATIGDTIGYKVPITLPSNLKAFDEYILIVRDTMSKGLTFVPDSVRVNGDVVAGTGTYAVTATPVAGQPTLVTITFNSDWVLAREASSVIMVTYDAILNQLAEVDKPETNEVELEYSNDPSNTAKTGTTVPPDEPPEVYTFDIDIYKYTGNIEDESDTPLGGAKFVLSRTGTHLDGQGTIAAKVAAIKAESFIDFIPVVQVSPGNFRVAVAGEANRIKEMTTHTDGSLNVFGLGAGTYYLYETETADDTTYTLLTAPVVITIIHDADAEGNLLGTATVNYSYGGQTYSNVEKINILNSRATLFPDTGGVGTTVFYIVGGLVMAGAIVTLIIRRRVAVK